MCRPVDGIGRVGERLDLVAYDASWPAAFEAERERIAGALGSLAVRIDHHGSTAVPGLAAKPIVDVQVSVRSLVPLDVYCAALATLGYVHTPHPDDTWCPYFFKPHAWPHTHHLHLVEAGGEPERRTLAFRDYLRDHVEVAREYERLKRDLIRAYEAGELASPEAYAAAKTTFVTTITEAALAAGYPR